jgi:uncharacterized protein (DUF2461 family)
MGAGMWALEADALARYRQAVAQPAAFSQLSDALAAAARYGMVPDEPQLKRLPAGTPAGIDPDGPQARLLMRKGLVVRTQGEQAWDEALFGPGAIAWLTERMQAAAGIDAFLRAHAGV